MKLHIQEYLKIIFPAKRIFSVIGYFTIIIMCVKNFKKEIEIKKKDLKVEVFKTSNKIQY